MATGSKRKKARKETGQKRRKVRQGDPGYDPYDFTSSEEEDDNGEEDGGDATTPSDKQAPEESRDTGGVESMDTESGGGPVALDPER